eukprot:6293512-Amphidinium_carterae.2
MSCVSRAHDSRDKPTSPIGNMLRVGSKQPELAATRHRRFLALAAGRVSTMKHHQCKATVS